VISGGKHRVRKCFKNGEASVEIEVGGKNLTDYSVIDVLYYSIGYKIITYKHMTYCTVYPIDTAIKPKGG
jgi:hypothetical protein